MASNEHNIIIEELPSTPRTFHIFTALSQQPYNFFLDSASNANDAGRYSFIGCDPFLVFSSKKDNIRLDWRSGKIETFKSDPFAALKSIMGKYHIDSARSEIPFLGGCVGYFAYDLKDSIEKLPDIAEDDLALPDCMVGLYDTIIVYDHKKKRAYLVSSGFPCLERRSRLARAKRRIAQFRQMVSVKNTYTYPVPYDRGGSSNGSWELRSNFSKSGYIDIIEKAKSYIKKGDIYQVNLSQRFTAALPMEPVQLYVRLREICPAPFFSYLDFGSLKILSSSPERFILKQGCRIETRPIKGTRPRGGGPVEDLRLQHELLLSKKDAAEHIMIVDLERNDLGRICEYGSVKPERLFILEKYSNVFHLVSIVSGRLKKNIGPVECLLAAFPGGSITGAPKIRAMEIIEELEPVKRSIYTGAIGYISFNGNMDTSIAIRTFLIKGSDIYFQVGGGIIADSDPEQEYDETIYKAKSLMEAIGIENSIGNKLYYKELVNT